MIRPDSVPAWSDERANQATLAERRRSRRRRLQGASEVSLCGTSADAEWTVTGVLLNAGVNGIACRVSTRAARALTIGQALQVIFRVGPTSAAFDLKARIANITPAGTTHHVVLGMEFVADGRLKSVQTKLLESLRRAGDEAG